VDAHPDNPKANSLDNRLPEEKVRQAVEESGYPLQIVVSAGLPAEFVVSEEWSFPDRDSGQARTLDALAVKQYEGGTNSLVRVALLIECKQSKFPFVFFKGPRAPSAFVYPLFAEADLVMVTGMVTGTARSMWELPIVRALSMDHEPLQTIPPVCSAFSKVVNDKKRIELSGTEPYNALVLPLVSALDHYRKEVRRSGGPATHGVQTVLLPVAVLDAPLVLVQVDAASNHYSLVPWVRVLRTLPDNRAQHPNQVPWGRRVAIDVVHKEFFATYVNQHVVPFTEKLATRIAKHQVLVSSGQGTLDCAELPGDIEAHLVPKA